MNARRLVFRGMFVAACALLAFVGPALGAGLQPQAPPHSHPQPHPRGHAPQPVPWPGATATKSSAPSTSSVSTSSVSTSIPTLRRTARVAVVVRAIHEPVAAPKHQRQQPARHSKAQPPAQGHGRPVGWRDAAAFNELRSVASSSSSALLLIAGIALLLLVIGETTFLGMASSRLGVAGPQGPVTPRAPEEPLAIRRVQLRR